MDLLVIANGRFQRGRAGRRWEKVAVRLRELFGSGVEICFTSGVGDATRRAREALQCGVGWLAAAGGDGTINEVVNGYFENGRNIQPKTPLSFLPGGSGNDWVRTLCLPTNIGLAVEALVQSRLHIVDVGLARFRGVNGTGAERVFLNVAEAGVGGRLIACQKDIGWLLRSGLGYRLASMTTALFYAPVKYQLIMDGNEVLSARPLLSLIVASGCYFGGGMRCAPMARPDDGLLEVITLGDFGWFEIIRKMKRFFNGDYLRDPKVSHCSVRTLQASSSTRVFLELDGEFAGTLPATFEVLPRALQLRY